MGSRPHTSHNIVNHQHLQIASTLEDSEYRGDTLDNASLGHMDQVLYFQQSRPDTAGTVHHGKPRGTLLNAVKKA